MKKRWFVLALIPLACGGSESAVPWDGVGVITAKTYDDPDDWTVNVCVAYNADGFCAQSVPVTEHDDAHWHVQVTSEDGREHVLEVIEQNWERCRRGAEWVHAELRCRG